MNFTAKDWDILKTISRQAKRVYSFGHFYTKEVTKEHALMEIIAKKICQKLALNCPNYQLVSTGNKYYIFSEDLNQKNIFFSAKEMGIDEKTNSSLPQIWEKLQTIYFNPQDLMFEIVKMMLMDIFFCNSDRAPINWGFCFTKDKRYIVALDHEKFGDSSDFNEINSFAEVNYGFNHKEKYLLPNGTLDFKNLKRDNILNLGQKGGKEVQKIISEMLNNFSPLKFAQILEEITQEEVIITPKGCEKITFLESYKDAILKRYAENYEFIENIWRNKTYGRQ